MDGLLLHPHTREQVVRCAATPPQSLLLVGTHGIGKTHIARVLVAQVLQCSVDQTTQHPYIMHITPDGTSISIDTIRELQRFMQLKTVGHGNTYRRAVIVEHAEQLTAEAQNAYLKLLEEPPADTIMVLTAESQRALLPTILSRVHTVTIHPPAEVDAKAYFAGRQDATALNQAYFLSGGLPGLMDALLQADGKHPLLEGVAQAKTLLQQSLFERLATVERLSKKKEEALHVLHALTHIAQTGLGQATTKGDTAKLKQWHHILGTAHQAQTALEQNANPKLTLTNLMLHL